MTLRIRASSMGDLPQGRPSPLMGGFTLLELLVVMTLISLLALAMTSSMRTMAQTEERVDARLLRADDFQMATSFLRSVLGRVSMRKLEPPPKEGANLYMFVAEPEALTWVGVMPARHGAGGRSVFRLAKEIIDNRPSLVLRFAPVSDLTSLPDWPTAEARVLAEDVTAFSLAFQDGRDPAAPWTAQWTLPDRLPSRVKLSVHTDALEWPDLIIPMRATPNSARSTGAVFGGE